MSSSTKPSVYIVPVDPASPENTSAIDGVEPSKLWSATPSAHATKPAKVGTTHIFYDTPSEKITALAQAMLLQKLSKANHTVNAQILIGAGTLSLNGGQLEFRSLLKLYSRECHTALGNDNAVILNAVSSEAF